jgi:putative Mg2+ transporter-C (MgtC) family protein
LETLQTDLVFIGRMLLAAALAFAIGWEREFRGSPAGDRTHTLVALGAAAFTSVSVDAFPDSAEKLIAGVVTGVGFLGAGMIMKESGEIMGLTTAAGMWAVAAVGVISGAGEYLMALTLAVIILLVLEIHGLWPFSKLEEYMRKHGAHAKKDGIERDRGG